MAEPPRPKTPGEGGGAATGGALEARPRAGRPEPVISLLEWVRTHRYVTVAVVGFGLITAVGLTRSLPTGLTRNRAGDVVDTLLNNPPADPPAPVASRIPEPPPAAPAPEPPPPAAPAAPAKGRWVMQPASTPSARGLALIYAYRTLPPGGDSRFEWYVRLQGDRALLERVDQVNWRMDPPPKNGDDLVSRNRAQDGFPLMGDGPGGWFGVSAIVRYDDGRTETLARQIELPD